VPGPGSWRRRPVGTYSAPVGVDGLGQMDRVRVEAAERPVLARKVLGNFAEEEAQTWDGSMDAVPTFATLGDPWGVPGASGRFQTKEKNIMCFCGKPTVNGQPGEYERYLVPPALGDGETLIFDEPGRCGGVDSHAYHFRVVKASYGGVNLLVRHGGGEERIRLSNPRPVIESLESLDSNGRYWILHALYHAQADARRAGHEHEAAYWRRAAAEKRIKVRKVRGQSAVKVSVIPAA